LQWIIASLLIAAGATLGAGLFSAIKQVRRRPSRPFGQPLA
jgi:hypothetical protein